MRVLKLTGCFLRLGCVCVVHVCVHFEVEGGSNRQVMAFSRRKAEIIDTCMAFLALRPALSPVRLVIGGPRSYAAII